MQSDQAFVNTEVSHEINIFRLLFDFLIHIHLLCNRSYVHTGKEQQNLSEFVCTVSLHMCSVLLFRPLSTWPDPNIPSSFLFWEMFVVE